MRRQSELPELLAPAGDFDCLVAAVKGGADAIYIGSHEFTARAYAKNFTLDEISRASSYCHLHGVKLYVTVNTLLSTKEISRACELARELYTIGVDALISADLGFIRAVSECVPELELHASTQMSVHNTAGADEAYRLGCRRVVLARELSLDNIKSAVRDSLAECEIFLHGALCVSHSGQCLFSSLVGGRSGNRGECAQPCRLNYNGDKYPLSLKDLSLAEHIPELIDSGVSSLKIEGRMKSPDYVYTVTSIYRRLLDENRRATARETETLERVFSRSGFTDGYLKGDLEAGMTGIRSAEDKSASRCVSGGEYLPERVKVTSEARITAGERASFTLKYKDISVTAYGDIPDAARNAPLTEDGVKARLAKMGNTYLSLDPSDILLTLDEGLNLSPASLNALRRNAVMLLEEYGRDKKYVDTVCTLPKLVKSAGYEYGRRTALFLNPEVIDRSPSLLDYFDISFVPLFSLDKISYTPEGVYLPPVILDSEYSEVKDALMPLVSRGVKYALVGNLGHLPLVREAGLIPIGDMRLNVWNSFAKDKLSELGIDDVILSPELTEQVTSSIGGRAIVYGRIPLMLTERCFTRDCYGCDRCTSSYLTDRRGERFPIIREWKHRNLILNSRITYMADKLSQLRERCAFAEHYIFSVETKDEIAEIIESYKTEKKMPLAFLYRRMGKREAE